MTNKRKEGIVEISAVKANPGQYATLVLLLGKFDEAMISLNLQEQRLLSGDSLLDPGNIII